MLARREDSATVIHEVQSPSNDANVHASAVGCKNRYLKEKQMLARFFLNPVSLSDNKNKLLIIKLCNFLHLPIYVPQSLY